MEPSRLISRPAGEAKARQKVCVIGESDPFVARLLHRFAEESGFEARWASDGQDVLDLAGRVCPKAIILEIELPGEVRGWEVVGRLKSDPETARIPLITCSWLGKDETHSLAEQADGHLTKTDLHYDGFVAVLREAGIELA